MEQLYEEVKTMFTEYAGNSLQFSQLETFLDSCGFEKPPGFKIREFAEKYDSDHNGTLCLTEFMKLFEELETSKKFGAQMLEMIKSKGNIFMLESSSRAAEGTKHSATEDEIIGMAQYINLICEKEEQVKHLLPIKSDGVDLFTKVNDGILLCQLLNLAVPGTIDIRAINLKPKSVFQKQENHVLVLNSASAIGIHTVNMDSQVLLNGVPHMVLGLIWQILKKYLLSKINLKDNPHLSCMLMEGENMQQFLALAPEEILVRWVNYQLARSPNPMVIKNLSSEIKDSTVYSNLLKQVAPGNSVLHEPESILSKSDLNTRADMVLQNCNKLSLPQFLTPRSITSGNAKLNLAFVASIFKQYPNLEVVEIEVPVIEETREEKMYRNWMNSLGANPFVYHLYEDLNNGQILLFLMNEIKQGHVPDSVIKKYSGKMNNMKVLETCNEVITYAKKLGVNTTTCSGSNIRTAGENKEMFLGIVWQLVREYTVAMLVKLSGGHKKMDDKSIIEWANSQVSPSYHINNFGDQKLKDSSPIAALIEAIKPKSINLTLLKSSTSEEDLLQNAQYCVSIARKIGAKVYALPEDIVDVKSKMIMTIYACLMTKYMEEHKE